MIYVIVALFAASYIALCFVVWQLGRTLVRHNEANLERIRDQQNRLDARNWVEYGNITEINAPPAPAAPKSAAETILDQYSQIHTLEGG